jgi:hypothetical protein
MSLLEAKFVVGEWLISTGLDYADYGLWILPDKLFSTGDRFKF